MVKSCQKYQQFFTYSAITIPLIFCVCVLWRARAIVKFHFFVFSNSSKIRVLDFYNFVKKFCLSPRWNRWVEPNKIFGELKSLTFLNGKFQFITVSFVSHFNTSMKLRNLNLLNGNLKSFLIKTFGSVYSEFDFCFRATIQSRKLYGFNFKLIRILGKWLKDVQVEILNTISYSSLVFQMNLKSSALLNWSLFFLLNNHFLLDLEIVKRYTTYKIQLHPPQNPKKLTLF